MSDTEKGWLKEHFGDAVSRKDGDKYVTRLPHAYRILPSRPLTDREKLMSAFGMPPEDLEARLEPVQVTTRLKKEGLAALYNEVARGGHFYLYHPKPGQNEEEVIDTDKSYPIVRHNHPLHAHENAPYLIDFVRVDVRRSHVIKDTLDGAHSHLLIKDLVPPSN